MATPTDEARATELDSLLDEWLAARAGGEDAGLSATPDEELAQMLAAAAAVGGHVGSVDDGSGRDASGGSRRWSANTLLRVAGIALVTVAIGAGALALRGTRGASTPPKPAAIPPRVARCLEGVHPVKSDGPQLSHQQLLDVLSAIRAAGDPCPTRPIRWVKTSGSLDGEVEGAFFRDPVRRTGAFGLLWFQYSGDQNSISSGAPPWNGALRALGHVHRLRLAADRPRPASTGHHSLPGRLPRWATRHVESQITSSHGPVAQWVVTTAAQIRRANPYEVEVPPRLPDDAPIFIVSCHFTPPRVSFFVFSVRIAGRPGRILSESSQTTLEGFPISHFGTVHHWRLPPSAGH
jgi:hypothetical protein